MTQPWSVALLLLLAGVAIYAPAQQDQREEPAANPARPTVSTPATLTPAGYFQLETGFLGAWHSPEFSSQSSFNEVVKFSITRRIELLAAAGPFAHSRVGNQTANGTGDVALGVQAVVHQGEGVRPTIAVSYFRRVYSGDAPDLDIGSARNSVLLLASADVKGFHYDTNCLFNEVIDNAIHRAQFGQTLSVSHPLVKRLGISGEIWHFTQPFLRGHAVGNLWALNYNLRKNLVLDGGFSRGLTSTSMRWEVFLGFTYLLPHKVSARSTPAH
ncbi:MAG: transporter [Acidobacteriia bacterium]|nr:transporter [Terriglobia bacterium]